MNAAAWKQTLRSLGGVSLILLLCLNLLASAAQAGRSCESAALTPRQIQAASVAAQRTFQALEEGPGDLALVARVGQDLSRHGLRYSHVGLALRDHPNGPWTVLHLLNACGSADSGIYAEGLLNFFLDGMLSYDSRIIWLRADVEQELLRGLQQGWATQIHDTRYNVIARPDSTRNQNSTGWMLSLLGLALDPPPPDRAPSALRGWMAATTAGFEPTQLRLSYSKRVLGGLFSANADFTDHPVRARLRGRYPVVSVRSIFEWLRRADLVQAQWTNPGAPSAD